MFKKTTNGITKLLVGIYKTIKGEDKPTDKVIDVIDPKPPEIKEKPSEGKQVMSKQGLADMVLAEGIILTKYLDSAGVLTVAIGATKSEVSDIASWPNDKALTIEQCFELLKKSNERYEKGVRRALKVPVSQQMFDGLVSFAYNVGVHGMTHSSLVRAINNGETSEAKLKPLLMRWNKITRNGRKVVSRGLINRRKKEAQVMFRGKYKNPNFIGYVIPVNSRLKPVYIRGKKIDIRDYL